MSTSINVAGFSSCGDFQRARTAAQGLGAICPDKFTANIKEFADREEYNAWLAGARERFGASSHTACPIVWLNDGTYLGDDRGLVAWSRRLLGQGLNEDVANAPDGYDPSHSFDYDLIVIGGGSGGLACAKEAQKLGARVAVLDFVKPSPHGTTWGLGGTCVNVGCIPKKLMHTAALMGESALEAETYGWKRSGSEAPHSWSTLRDNVQDHIKSLNFGYRVQLREEGVTYLNKLGKFVGPNTLEVVDKKGKKETITGARFVVAVGGRPTPLQCPGGELAISSDDLFSLESPPGKTCVVGASYVALECAGFIHGLNQGEVSVLIRSIPLRGFDRDTVGRVMDYMNAHGIKTIEGVTPTAIEKLESGRLLVRFSDDRPAEEFDTVLAAVGRRADTHPLGLESVGVQVNPSNGKIIGINEQSNVPNVYAIGDVLDGTPELTPVAILAGKLLAGRLFGGAKTSMDYSMVPTAVFTPLEMGNVGLSEEAAIEKYGADNIDCVVSAFHPLEWTLNEARHSGVFSFAKIVFDKSTPDQRVLGLHIACPNAGEVIQGFAVALRKGLTLSDLRFTVGIHPTVAEEFTVMSALKSSGDGIDKAGC